jgi:hypothetical protein
MSVEQWGVLALVVLLPLLQGVARFRRAHASNGEAIDRVGEVRTLHRGLSLPNRDADDRVGLAAKQMVSPPPSLPPPLPQPVSPPAISRSGLPASHASSLKGSASFEAHTRTGKPVGGDAVVQWLRPVRNLRRAIVVATILGPPTQ